MKGTHLLIGALVMLAGAMSAAAQELSEYPTGNSCPLRFGQAGGQQAAFLDHGYGSCWSCPDSLAYVRTAAPVTAPNACAAYAVVAPAEDVEKWGCTFKYGKDKGIFPDPNGNCYSCPAGYTRGTAAITSDKACFKYPVFGPFGKPTERGPIACDHPREYTTGLTEGYCFNCPDGFGVNPTGNPEDSDGCLAAEVDASATFRGWPGAPPVHDCPAAPSLPSADHVTFFVATDLHFGKQADGMTTATLIKNAGMINGFGQSAAVWPSGFAAAGDTIGPPVALVTTGDLTHYGHDAELNFYRWLYENENRGAPYRYEGAIRYPVYVGLGNHDTDGQCTGNLCAIRMFAYVNQRNRTGCMGVTNYDPWALIDPKSADYSWDWNDVHYVQLHDWAGSTNYGDTTVSHAPGLGWLKDDLANMASTQRAVVLFQHFGFDEFAEGWWPKTDQAKFYDVIKDYNVIAIFVGHTHEAKKETWNGIDVFYGGAGGEYGHGYFIAVRVSRTNLDVMSVKWYGDGVSYPDPYSLTKGITTR